MLQKVLPRFKLVSTVATVDHMSRNKHETKFKYVRAVYNESKLSPQQKPNSWNGRKTHGQRLNHGQPFACSDCEASK